MNLYYFIVHINIAFLVFWISVPVSCLKDLKKMRYVAAYMLAALGGKDAPTTSDIEKILSSVGIECDSEKLNIVVNQMKGKSIDELVAQGMNIKLFIN